MNGAEGDEVAVADSGIGIAAVVEISPGDGRIEGVEMEVGVELNGMAGGPIEFEAFETKQGFAGRKGSGGQNVVEAIGYRDGDVVTGDLFGMNGRL